MLQKISLPGSKPVQKILDNLKHDYPKLGEKLHDIFVTHCQKEIDFTAFETCLKRLHEVGSIDYNHVRDIRRGIDDMTLEELSRHSLEKALRIVVGYTQIGLAALSIEKELEKAWDTDLTLPKHGLSDEY